ncbi:hypothetical protein [Variovorax paradoxus]|uniref:hypothetical protein n=1 Tax=Variovorax paradoxus TaxID=34073 RepID=UPI003ECD4084
MPRTTTAAVVQIAQHKPYAPPLAHKVHITAPYLPACATDVRATIERVRGLLASQGAGRRKPRRADALAIQQADMFPSTVLRIVAQQQRRAA